MRSRHERSAKSVRAITHPSQRCRRRQSRQRLCSRRCLRGSRENSRLLHCDASVVTGVTRRGEALHRPDRLPCLSGIRSAASRGCIASAFRRLLRLMQLGFASVLAPAMGRAAVAPHALFNHSVLPPLGFHSRRTAPLSHLSRQQLLTVVLGASDLRLPLVSEHPPFLRPGITTVPGR